jgi:uncharacterized FAD-dependent dehydrogenase
MLKATNVRVPVGADESSLTQTCARILRVKPNDIRGLRVLRKSLDIRNKRRLEHVYTLAVGLDNESAVLHRLGSPLVTKYRDEPFECPRPGDRPLEHRPVVVGAGPAGLFAALFLAEFGYCPLVLERGKVVRERIMDVAAFDGGGPLDPESNYLFGEGGAGTFSDGKLTCRTTGPDTLRVLEILAECKGKPSIVYEAKPHLGSNRLPAVVKALRRRIIDAGGEFRFQCRVDDLEIIDGRIRGLLTTQRLIRTEVVVLAIGHSARDTYAMLARRGVPMRTKAFQMGVRIEQPQDQVTRVQYGDAPLAELIGPADYSMTVRVDHRELFTFCMCAGGYVIPSVSQPEHFCTNGMSRSRHESRFANSGLVVTVDPTNVSKDFGADALGGVRYQAQIESAAFRLAGENYSAPIQWAKDFLCQRQSVTAPPTSHFRGARSVNLWHLLPADVAEILKRGLPVFDRQWNGQFLHDASLTGPEARGSAPVRIVRDRQTRESHAVAGLYPVGEGAGYAGGIVSAAVDGLRTAKAIIRTFRPLLSR